EGVRGCGPSGPWRGGAERAPDRRVGLSGLSLPSATLRRALHGGEAVAEESDGGHLARRWVSRLEQWIARAAVAKSGEEAPARPAGDVTEARVSMSVQDGGPMSQRSRSEQRACAQCGRVLRWALPLCWDCDAAMKKA